MKESRDGTKTDRISKSPSVNSGPLVLDEEDFKVKTPNSVSSIVACFETHRVANQT